MKTSRLASPANPSGALQRRVYASALPVVESSLFSAISRVLKRLAGALGLGMIACSATAANVNLKWNANPETDIASYRVNYGTSSGSRPGAVSAGLNIRASVTGLQEGTTYYFAVTAINLDGLESEPSDEISYQVPVTATGPVAVSKSATTGEDTPVAIGLAASDPNSLALTYSIVSGPAKGTLSGTAPNLTYTPATDANGADSFTYKANNGTVDSNTATVSISVSPVNDLPIAVSKSANTNEDTPVAIALSANDIDGDSLTYSIVSGPAKGTLSGTAPNLTYTPSTDSNGADSFTYKASDATASSLNATVSITVSSVNDAPVAVSKSASTAEDSPVAIALAGSDKDGDSLTYAVVGGPTKGTLSGTPPNLTYTPSTDFNGVDSFTYKTSDASLSSLNATVSITVSSVNDAPVAVSKSASTAEDSPVAIALTASDKDGNNLTYTIVSGPSKGTLAGTAPNLTYMPSADFNGTDSFTYKASDATLSSPNATVSITVSSVNDVPFAISKSATTNESTPVAIVVSATDKDGDSLTYSIVSNPAGGTLSGTPPNLTYSPSAGFSGADSFAFTANDGTANSPLATISIEVTKIVPPDDANLISQDGWVLRYVDSENTAASPAVNAFDGNPETFWHTGMQSGAAPQAHEIQIDLGRIHTLKGFRYLPRQDGNPDGNIGQYEFYTSIDGTNWGLPVATGTFVNSMDKKEVFFAPSNAQFIRLRSLTEVNGGIQCNVAELNLLWTVAVNQAPVVGSQSVTTTEKTPVTFKLTGTDRENDLLTYSVIKGPASGKLSGTAPDLTYTPKPGFIGEDSITFQASDGKATSNIATVSVAVTPRRTEHANKAPAFKSNPITLNGGYEGELSTNLTITETAEDPDEGDTITYSKVAGPGWLKISGTGRLSGSPPAGSRGVNRFTVRATDDKGAFTDSLLLIKIDSDDLPLPWEMDQLGGGKNTKDLASHKAGTITLKGSGALTGTEDAGSLVWQTLSGDGEIIARVDSIKGGEDTTRAGLMIRDSLAPNSNHVFLGVDGDGGFRWVRRTQKGKPSATKSTGSGSIPNAWMRLVRKGDTIIGYKSTDGSDWKRVGATTVELGQHCYIGLLMSGGKGNTGAAIFREVKVKH